MREIKFRAWDKEKKRMCRVLSVGTNDDGTAALLTLWASFGQVDAVGDGYPKRFELMQYIGLKDKKGKEIYEGDRVIETDEHGNTDSGIIGFRSGAFVIDWGKTFKFLDDTDSFEITGNIYENPEAVVPESE